MNKVNYKLKNTSYHQEWGISFISVVQYAVMDIKNF